MALLRDAFRLGLFEPLARWKLLRDLELKRKGTSNHSVNGDASRHIENGNGNNEHANDKSTAVTASRRELRQLNRSVLRFAEQGWSVVYYSLQWSFGLVRI